MVTCRCGASAAPGDVYCQQCGQPLGMKPTSGASSQVAPSPAPAGVPGWQQGSAPEASGPTGVSRAQNWGAGLADRLDRFAEEGQSGGLVRGSLADAVAVLRQEQRPAFRAIAIVMGVAMAGFVVVGVFAALVTGGLLATLFGAASRGDDLTSGAAAAGIGLIGLWLVLPTIGALVSAITVSVAGTAHYLPLLGRLSAYRHRQLDEIGSRWARSVGPTILALFAAWAAYFLCILPGLYVFGRVAFTPHEAIAGKSVPGRGPLGRSWDRTSASVWSVVGLTLLSGLIVAVPVAAAWVLAAVVSAAFEDSGGGLALLIILPTLLLLAAALALAAALPPLPLAAAWLRITRDDVQQMPPTGLDQETRDARQAAPPGITAPQATSPASSSADDIPSDPPSTTSAISAEPADLRPAAAVGLAAAASGVSTAAAGSSESSDADRALEDSHDLGQPVGGAPSGDEVGTCPTCGAPIEHGNSFCGSCGTPASARPDPMPDAGTEVSATPIAPARSSLAQNCQRCGNELPPHASFCGACGSAVLVEEGQEQELEQEAPAAESSTCQQCGGLLEPDSQFCGDCGSSVLLGTTPTTAALGRTGAKRRRWPLALAGTLVLATMIASGVIWGLPLLERGETQDLAAVAPPDDSEADAEAALPATPTPEAAATEMPQESATATAFPAPADATEQLRVLADEGAEQLATIADGTWMPQVSSKCGPLTATDYEDASGRIGWPDGSQEDFPNGLTDEEILAFHVGLTARLGLTTSDVILVTPDGLGIGGPPPAACGSAPIWISLVASEQYATQEGALDYCTGSGLPPGECAARSVGADTQFALPTGDEPDPSDPDTYPVIVDSYLSVRTEPSVDAPEVGRVPTGGYVTIVCTTDGDAVTDPFGDVISRWDGSPDPSTATSPTRSSTQAETRLRCHRADTGAPCWTRCCGSSTRPTSGAPVICPNGHEVRPGVKFCKTCGGAVDDKPPGPAESSPLEPPAPPSAAGELVLRRAIDGCERDELDS